MSPGLGASREARTRAGLPRSQCEHYGYGRGTVGTDEKPCPEIVVIYIFIVAMDLI